MTQNMVASKGIEIQDTRYINTVKESSNFCINHWNNGITMYMKQFKRQ